MRFGMVMRLEPLDSGILRYVTLHCITLKLFKVAHVQDCSTTEYTRCEKQKQKNKNC